MIFIIIISLTITLAYTAALLWQVGQIKRKRGKIKMTNFEKIKQMSVEEMATYLCSKELPICPLQAPHCRDDNCPKCFKKWLESEVLEDE